MKDRQVLDISCLDHTLGVAELEWMKNKIQAVNLVRSICNLDRSCFIS